MADILCPVCGKANPEGSEICQYCGALLKNRGTEPLAPIHPGEMPTPKKTSELERTLPGWLRNIRKGDNSQAQTTASPEQPAQNEQPAPPPAAPPPPPPKKDEPPVDLLAGLSQSDEEEEEVPDWLASLKTNLPGGSVPAPEPAATEAEQPADWLAALQGDSPSQQPAPDLPAADSGVGSGSFSFNQAEESSQQASDDTPDWMAALNNPPAQNTPAPVQPAPTEPASGGTDLPDWLGSLGNEAPQQPAAGAAPTADDLPSDGDLSGWFSGLDNAGSAPAAAPAGPAGDLPDWMAGLGEAQAAPPQMPVENTPAESTQTPSAPAMSEPASPAEASDDGLPDWLAAAVADKTSDEAPPVEPAASAKAFSTGALEEVNLGANDAAQVPDWMAGLGGSTVPETTTAQPEQPVAPPIEPAPAPGVSGADNLDWLSELAAGTPAPSQNEPAPAAMESAPPAAPQQPAPSFEAPTPQAETPPPAATPAFENNQNLDSILSMDMPDWLAGFTPTETDAAKTPAGQPGAAPAADADLSPASLPSWVQAMRPMEAVISGAEGGEEDQNVEKEGPLAGLRSVLPAHTEAPGSRKPKAYSIKLQVDATQQAQAALLENLIASEAESQPIVTPKRVVTIRPLRWIIAAVLLLAVLIPAVLGLSFFPAPSQEPENEIGKFHSLVESLPDGGPVLLVFDYQPGYAGELEQAASPVVRHLVDKNMRLALVSSSPTGVLMSENMMDRIQAELSNENKPPYPAGDKYVDLGYLPGGEAGIQVFANNPRVLGNDYTGEPGQDLWNTQALAGISKLSDFGTLIVLTDNPDTGRMWIEQTGQALQGQPMLMIVSAQAEPMIRPYYDSGQIHGMISGLAGGTVYEEFTKRPGQASQYWDSYGASMIAAELLVIVGGAWALVEHLRTRRMEQQLEEDEA